MTNNIEFRRLSLDDALLYKEMRLKALQTNPEAFLSTFDAEITKGENAFAYELKVAHQPSIWGYYGVFVDQKLVGFCQISKSYLAKQRHIAFLYNLYVNPDFRGQGLAKKIVNFVLEKMKSEQIERVYISYLAKNKCVDGFYDHLGFTRCGLKPQAAKSGDEYDDEIMMTLEL